MDKRQWATTISLTVAIFSIWLGFNIWYHKNFPTVENPPAATAPASTAPAALVATSGPAATNPSSQPTSGPVLTVGLHVAPTTQPVRSVSLGSAASNDPTYVMQVNLQPNGAGLFDVVLNEFNAPKLHRKDPASQYHFQSLVADKPDTAALATRSVVIDGVVVDLTAVQWDLLSYDPASADFRVTIVDGNEVPIAEVRKHFAIQPKADKSLGYEMAVTQVVANLRTDRPIVARWTMNGTTPPPTEQDNAADRFVVGAYRAGPADIVQKAFLPTDFYKDKPDRDITGDSSEPLLWVAQSNAYFTAVILPDATLAQSGLKVRAEALEPAGDGDRKVVVTIDMPDTSIAAGQSSSMPLTVFLGPKWRHVLNTPHYTAYPRMYDRMLGARYQSQNTWVLFAILSGICQMCQWQWLINALVWILGAFHYVLRDWGLAIICLVLCVRGLLHPLTKRSQVQMVKMGKMGPEVEKLKKKYADDPDQLNKEMVQLYKQQGGAMLGCLPMFLQMPIWIALWSALQGTFELRQAPFLYGFTWIDDLSRPDRLYDFGGPMKIFFFTIFAINILPLLMAAVTFINQKYFMPQPIAVTEEQKQQQQTQQFMSLLFPLMFYSMPSGLNLYYLTTTTLGILESKIIRDHIKEQEELAKAMGPELVPTKGTRAARRREKDEPEKPKAQPGYFSRLFEQLAQALHKAQEEAEKMKKESQTKDKGKKK